MLRFFRNIRQKLIEQENVRKYIWYALGEIFLVVIGILIALQINNWNIANQEKKLEIRYLERLITELNQDLGNISNAIESNNARKDRALFLMESTENSSIIDKAPTYFIESIEYAGYTYSPPTSIQTFEEIKSSGHLSLIRNEDVRNSISVYYTEAENRGQYTFISQQIQLKYLDLRVGILSNEQQIAMGSFSNSTEYTVQEAKEVHSRMIAEKAFVEWLPFVIQSKIRAGENLEGKKKEVLELKQRIMNELEERN